jgi:hypothetical protein
MTPETEERISRQLTTFEELVKHLATKEELQRLRGEMILWIIGTNVLVGATVISALMFYVNDKFTELTFFLQHWKP